MAFDLGAVFGGRWIMKPVYDIASGEIEGLREPFTYYSVDAMLEHIEGKRYIYISRGLCAYYVEVSGRRGDYGRCPRAVGPSSCTRS